MKTIALTVLATEGPQARVYLAAMRRAGLQPERIVLLISSIHLATRKPVAPWMPMRARRWIAGRMQEASANAWPRRIRAREPSLVNAYAIAMEPVIKDSAGLIEEIGGAFDFEKYAVRVDRVMVRGLSDPALSEHLASISPTAVLFTGGGIVRRNLLDIEGIRFIHVHPGKLPEVRGGDGLLWSILLRGRPGSSSFYMDAGIDTGEMIVSRDFEPIQIELGPEPRPDDMTLYRSVFSFVDLLYRLALLIEDVLGHGDDPLDYSAETQNEDEGVTYHFLHERLRSRALEILFANGT